MAPSRVAQLVLAAIVAGALVLAMFQSGRHQATHGKIVSEITGRLTERPTPLRWPLAESRYLPPTSVRRGAPPNIASRLASLRVSSERGGVTGQALVLLAVGEGAAAVAPLERALAANPHDLELLRALAAAYASRASLGHDPRDWPRALDLTTRVSAAIGPTPEGMFNRAMILERIGATSAALAAWSDFLDLEPTGPWADEARHEQTSLVSSLKERQLDGAVRNATDVDLAVRLAPADARQFAEIDGPAEWGRAFLGQRIQDAARIESEGAAFAHALQKANGNTMAIDAWQTIRSAKIRERARLAQGHVSLREGFELYDRDLRTQAADKFQLARDHLRSAHSPVWLWAEIQLAVVANQRRDRIGALEHLNIVRTFASSKTYSAVLAREAMLRGVVLFVSAGPAAAFREYRTGIALYEQLRELGDAASSYNTAADSARMVGDPFEGWGYVAAALSRIDYVRSSFRRYQVYFSAANLSLHDGLLDAALVFQNLALAEARGRGPTGTGFVAEALIRRSIIFSERRNADRAMADLDDAERLLPLIGEEAARAYHGTWIRARRGVALLTQSPMLARYLLASAIDGFQLIEPSGVPGLTAERARAALTAGDVARGYAELQQAAADLERRRAQLEELGSRISYFDDSWRLYQDLVGASLLASGDWYAAMRIAEDGRARSLTETRPLAALPELAALQARLSTKSDVLLYFVLPDQTLWWRIGKHVFEHGSLPLTEHTLVADVDRLTRSLEEGDTAEADRQLEVFFDSMLRPALQDRRPDSLLIVPDGPLHRVPFSAARDRRLRRYLVEDTAVTVSPSLRLALEASTAIAKARTHTLHVLSVGRAEQLASAGLPALPAAVNEVEAVAGEYREATVLLYDDATPSRFLSEVARADVVHFAGHAVANNAYPAMSYLLLNPERGSETGALFAYQLLTLDSLRARLVVLAACRTGSGAVPKGEGPLSLAWPVLGAGVPSVVASLWDLDDAAAGAMMPRLHRAFAAGAWPGEALRLAQLAYMSNTKDVTKWSALAAIGGAKLN